MLKLRAAVHAAALVLALPGGGLASATAQVAPAYQDDRSGPVQVLESLVNALNRHEYARAYGYWEAGSSERPAYDDFAAGYADTRAVELTTGPVESDAGAGQLYYAVPVTLWAQLADGTDQIFVGCYRLHLAQPAIQEPPFRPLGIRSASVQQVWDASDLTERMGQACAPADDESAFQRNEDQPQG